MTAKEIRKALKARFPEAKTIARNEYGLWDVTVIDEFKETVLGFALRDGQLCYCGSTVFEI